MNAFWVKLRACLSAWDPNFLPESSSQSLVSEIIWFGFTYYYVESCGLVVKSWSLNSKVLGSSPDHNTAFSYEYSWMRSVGECLIANLFTQWLRRIDECLPGQVKGLLKRLGSNFSAWTNPLKSCIRFYMIWFHMLSYSGLWLSGIVLLFR